MDWLWWLGLGVAGLIGLIVLLGAAGITYVIVRYLGFVVRIFEEKPLFIIPRGESLPGAEDVRFPTTNGLTLAGSYLRTQADSRRGVILFGPEFGSTRWSCGPYCQALLQEGFDIFTFECRNYGESDKLPGYEPMQWVTEYELDDMRAALRYLKSRSDADHRGIGFFGISRGGGAGIEIAAEDPWIRCLVTDGAFATMTTMIPYMKKWVSIYCSRVWTVRLLPSWVYTFVAWLTIRRVAKKRGISFPSMERAMPRLAPRPLLMIHGGNDTYIKPEITQSLFNCAREPKELWLVDGAKHNQALNVAGELYQRKLVDFFSRHLGTKPVAASEPQLETVSA